MQQRQETLQEKEEINLKYSMTKICISHDFHEEDVQ